MDKESVVLKPRAQLGRNAPAEKRPGAAESRGALLAQIFAVAALALLAFLAGLVAWAALTGGERNLERPIVVADIPPASPAARPPRPQRAETPPEPPAAPPPSDAPGERSVAVTEPAAEAADRPEAAAAPETDETAEEEAAAVTEEMPPLAALVPRAPARIEAGAGDPWRAFARPFPAGETRPRIAILLTGLGLSQSATTAAIRQLPGAVTLAFTPYSRDLGNWIAQARAAGHEVMLQMPMEPFDYPANDPGPHTLLTTLTAEDNRDRLDWVLGRGVDYVGVVNEMGSKFTSSGPAIRPILEELGRRGLMFLDSRSSERSVAARIAREIGLPRAVNNRYIDNEASRAAISRNLEILSELAARDGYAIGIGNPYPATIEQVAEWARGLEERGLALAPVSAIVNRQSLP